jgi:hypothetical protein
MKQIIVLIAMILLGISIAGFVNDFGQSAHDLSNSTNAKIDNVTSGAF